MSGTRPVLVLVGLPGAGKSTVGELLAERLGVTFRDCDHDVEQTAGMTIADLFVTRGEAYFRELEKAAVRTALAEHDGVLALGGGAVTDPETRALLAGERVAFLEVGLADAAKRVGLNRDRPLLLGNVRAQWLKLAEQRRPWYEEVATVTVKTDGQTPEEVADAVLGAFPAGVLVRR